jgi:hypothetical protein
LANRFFFKTNNSVSAHFSCCSIILKKGRDAFVDAAIRNSQAETRTGKTVGGKKMRGFHASDLNLKSQAMAHFWVNLMSRFDADGSGEDACIIKAEKFSVEFFQNITPERYTFFVEKE